jgi:hypothetical protein
MGERLAAIAEGLPMLPFSDLSIVALDLRVFYGLATT